MSILVTGGAGFIGSHMIERLLRQSDDQIICLDNFNDYYDPELKRANVALFVHEPRVEIVEESFCNRAAMQGLFARGSIRSIVHLGAYAGVRPSIANPLVYEENNVRGTLVLLEEARARPLERFVFVSSSTVYGRGAEAPFREEAPLGVPTSPYGATKQAAELWGQIYLNLYGVSVVCLRPFSVYGPRQRPDLSMSVFTAAIRAGTPLPLFGDGTILRDFTHVSDVCDGLLAALTAPHVVGQAINLGHNQPVEIRELIAMLEDALGRKAKIDRQPPVSGDMPISIADLSKAKRLLGYEPRVSLAEGVKEFVEWFAKTHA